MTQTERSIEHRVGAVSGVFVFLLLGVFALFSTLMVLLSAQLYRGVVDHSEIHQQQRLPGSYLMNTLRGSDREGCIAVTDEDGVPVLVISDGDAEDPYQTQIYCHDGMLVERYMSADEPFDAEMGEPLCACLAFLPERTENGVVITLVDGTGSEQKLFAAIRTGK